MYTCVVVTMHFVEFLKNALSYIYIYIYIYMYIYIYNSQELQPFPWLRYIDNIFFIWTHGTQELDSFLNELDKFHPNLIFTYETSKERVNFLDLNVSLRNVAISTDLYIKPIDGEQYLHYNSSHPAHIKNSIPYSQAIRLSRIFSSE